MADKGGVTLAKAWVTIIPTTEGAEKSISDAIVPASESAGKEAGKKTGGSLASTMGKSLAGTGATMTAAVTTPLLGIGTAAVGVGMQFESSMQNVAALSGATGDELALLESTARDFGSTTQFSASQAADAMGYMALAGWDTEQMVGGLGGVLQLAAASGMDLAGASDMVTDYLSAFGMQAEDSAYFADMLAYAQANSNTSASALGDAYKNCAANLNAAGQDVETTTSLLAMMANQGLKGSEAGTALNAIMRDITSSMEDGAIHIGETAVAVTDADGNFRDLSDILLDVEAATDGMGDAERAAALQTTFTSDSTKGLNLLLNAGVGEAAAFEEGLRGSTGTAQTMADTMNNSLTGRMAELNSAVEECGIQLFETLAPALTTVVEGVNGAVSAFSNWWSGLDSGTQTLILGAVGVVAALGPVIAGIGGVLLILPGLASGLGTVKTAFSGLSTVLRANPIGIVITAIAGLAAILVTAYNNNEDFRNAVDTAWQWLQDNVGPIFEGIGSAIGGAFEAIQTTVGTIWGAIQSALNGDWSGLSELASTAFEAVSTTIGGVWTNIQTAAGTAWETVKTGLSTTWDGISAAAGPVFEGIGTTVGGVWDSISTTAGTTWATIQSALGSTWETISTTAGPIFEGIGTTIGGVWDGIQTTAGTTWATVSSALSSTWETIKGTASEKFEAVKSNLGTVWENVSTTAGTTWATISSALTSTWESVKSTAKTKFNTLKSNLETTWNNVTSTAGTKWATIKSALTSTWESVKSTASTKFDTLKGNLETTWNNVSTTAGTTWATIQGALGSVWDGISGNASTVFGGMQGTLSGIWDGIKSTAGTTWGAIQSAMSDPIGTAKDLIDGFCGTISGIIGGLDLSLPSIALPHFWVSGGEFPWGIAGQGTPPSFGVDWYAKGGIFNGANLIGVGEAGPEAVVPLNQRGVQPFADAILERLAGGRSATPRQIVIEHMEVRDEYDIEKIARALYRLEREEGLAWA